MTCIKFYSLNASNYTELLGNLEYLHKAQNHLKYELESDNQWVQVEPGIVFIHEGSKNIFTI